MAPRLSANAPTEPHRNSMARTNRTGD
jgi:hypothetical protein